ILKIEYDFFINFDNVQHYQSALYVEPNSTYFEWGNSGTEISEEEGKNGNDFSIHFSKSDDIGSFNYTDLTKDSLYSRLAWIDQKSYIVQEERPKIEWELSEDFEVLAGFKCQRAIGAFRGRTYE